MSSTSSRGGRPRSPNPKSLRINVRFAAHERAEVERQAAEAGVSMSEFLRMTALRSGMRASRASQPSFHIDAELFHELRRQGVNLHQIVKHLNIHQTPPGAFEQDILEILARIRGIMNRSLPS